MNPFAYTPRVVNSALKYGFTITSVVALGGLAYSIHLLYKITGEKTPELKIKEAKGTSTLEDTLKDTT